MSPIIHTGDDNHPSNSLIFPFGHILRLIGMNTAHSSPSELFFYKKSLNERWHTYDDEVTLYRTIAESPFLIIYGEHLVNRELARHICYAMLKKRPILIIGSLKFSRDTMPFTRSVIAKRLHSFYAISLAELELTKLSLFLSKVKPVDYSLSKHEKVLINACIKAHFRILAEQIR
jgi:hypothetical protein